MGVKETAINVAPLHSIFVSKHLDHGNNRPKTTCVSSGKFFLSLRVKLCNILFLLKVMFFSCYKNENISCTKYPMSTYPTKKITLACYVCLCLITGAASLFFCATL